MKSNLLLIGLLLFLTACHSIRKTEIKVILTDYKKAAPVTYYITNPNWYLDLPDTIYADTAGIFTVETSLSGPQIFLMFCRQDSGSFMCPPILIKPGEKHLITCKLTKNFRDKNAVSVIGPNSDGQGVFLSIDDGVRSGVFEKSTFSDKWDISKPETLIDSFKIKTTRAILPYRKMLETKKVDKAFFNYAVNYINFYFAYQLGFIAEESVRNQNLRNKKDEFLKVSDYIFGIYPGPDNEILNSSVLEDFMIWYNAYRERTNKEKFDEFQAKGLSQTFELTNAKEVLSKEAYKYYAINYLWSRSFKYDPETLDLFEKYKLEYPDYTRNRAFQQLEKQSIPEINKFYSLKDKPLPEGVIFLDKEKPVNSFNELLRYFEGRYLFIDCWATWCGPCRYEFGFADSLKEFLSANDIQIVYLALENDELREKVEIFCKEYNLAGYHVVANKTFRKDITEKLGIQYIPRYVLIDKKGNIAIRETLLPSDKEKLFEQIKSVIDM